MVCRTENNFHQQLPRDLRGVLFRYAMSRRLLSCAIRLIAGLTLATAAVLICLLIDRMLALPQWVRLVLLCMLAGYLVFLAIWILFTFFRPIDYHRAACAMERCCPIFDQRLETLISQWLQPPPFRSSAPILQQLSQEVHQIMPRRKYRYDWARLIGWFAAAAATAISASALTMAPSLDLPQLARRLAQPLAQIPPVTTTRLIVQPGNFTITEQTPLTIGVIAQRLGNSPPVIHFSTDSVAYAQAVMSPGQGAFVWKLPSPEKNLTYYITGGDATSPVYHITVRHHPALVQMQVRYTYPAYTHHAPLDITASAGPIQAPVGTNVQLAITATEPLHAATFTFNGASLWATAGSAANQRVFEFQLKHDARAKLQLQAANGLSALAPVSVELRAIPDEPPLARLLEPAADLHLTPHDLFTVVWEALDDYGVDQLQLQLQINNSAVRKIALPVSGDRRRLTGSRDVDMATLGVKIGDMVTIWLSADDAVGHVAKSPARHILISPRSVDIDTYLRLSALNQASDLTAALADNLRKSAALISAVHSSSSQTTELYTDLSGAADAARLTQHSLLSVVQHRADPRTCTAMSVMADRIASASASVDRARRVIGADPDQVPAMAKRLDQVRQLISNAHDQLQTIAQGQRAAIVLADRANVREMAKPHQSDPRLRQRVQQTLVRAADEAAAGVEALGISVKAPDVDAQLIARIKAGDGLMASMTPVDLLAAAQDWAKQMAHGSFAPLDLPARLSAAAAIESVRLDSQPIWARDLQLAAQAADHIQEMARPNSIVSKAVLDKILVEYPNQLDALREEHRRSHRPFTETTQSTAVTDAAAGARAQMKLWAAEPGLVNFTSDAIGDDRAQDLAMEANARMAEHDYAGAAALDAQLSRSPEAQQARQNIVAAARAMHTAQDVDRVGARQKALAQRTDSARQPAKLANDQRKVVQSIDSVRRKADLSTGVNARDNAMAAIRHAQEQLAAMPAALADIQTGNESISDLRRQFSAASGTIHDMIAALSGFEPETSPAVDGLQHSLLPALRRLAGAVGSGRMLEINSAVTAARQAIADLQQRLQQSQQTFAEQDPLVAAKWYAQAAASALSQQPPDITQAHRQQTNAAHALQSAWNNAIRRAALNRLAGSNTISSVFSAAPSAAAASSAAPAWSAHTSPSELPDETQPAGYSAALRAYFQALSQPADR